MDKKLTVIEEIRVIKEKIALEHNFDIEKIAESLRQEQESSGRRIIRTAEQVGGTKEKRALVSG